MGTFPRETLYKPEYCKRLIEHMSNGLSYETFGALVDCGRQTLYDWEKAYPEWKHAKSIAMTKCQLFWETMGRDGIEKGSRDFNGAVWNFNMSARFKWSQKTESNVTVARLEDLLSSTDDSILTHVVHPKIEHEEEDIEESNENNNQ